MRLNYFSQDADESQVIPDEDEGMLIYRALLTQLGTDAPVATVLHNTLSGTVVWTRSGTGDYRGTLAGAFPVNKTLCRSFVGGDPSVLDDGTCGLLSHLNGNVVRLTTGIIASGETYADGVLNSSVVEILVYP